MKIKKVHVYPNVTWSTLTKNLRYDIAILELEKEVKLTAKVKSFHNIYVRFIPNFTRCFQYVFQEAAQTTTMQKGPR